MYNINVNKQCYCAMYDLDLNALHSIPKDNPRGWPKRSCKGMAPKGRINCECIFHLLQRVKTYLWGL